MPTGVVADKSIDIGLLTQKAVFGDSVLRTKLADANKNLIKGVESIVYCVT